MIKTATLVARHTPGEWTTARGDGAMDLASRFMPESNVLVVALGDCVHHPIADFSCNHTCRMDDECEANARLGAASPAMLLALRSIRAALDIIDPNRPLHYAQAMDLMRNYADEAIIKAMVPAP